MKVLFLFGPNLGALGTRDPERYGQQTLRGALGAGDAPVVEVHMTNIYRREGFRRHSVISPVCRATIAGAGAGGYHLALEAPAGVTARGAGGRASGSRRPA